MNKKNIKKDKNGLKNMFDYYIKNIFKKHFLIYIICMIIFALVFTLTLKSFNATTFLQGVDNVSSMFVVFKEFAIFLAVSLILGFIPFLPFSLVGILFASRLASYITSILFMREYNKTLLILLSIFLLFFLSFVMALGMNISKNISKRIKHNKKKNIQEVKSEDKV